jgi:hypothetical protein
MMVSSVQFPTADKQPPSPSSLEDDDTDATPPKGERSKTRGSVVQEKTLKFRFPPPKSNDDNVDALVLHIHWMHEVQTAFGEGVTFFDNNNRKIGKLDPLRNKPDSKTHHFAIHNVKSTSGTTSFIIHRIQSKFSLSDIKNTPNVANLMQKYDFYVNDHKWSETDWDTTQLGFFYGIDPQFFDLDQATCKIQEVLKKNAPKMKAPRFRLVYCSPKVRVARGGKRSIRTKAYAIETLRKDRDEMTRILKHAYKDDGTFIPFQMRSRHPDAFEKMIRAQTHLLAHNFVIILNYVGPDVMHYISERILAMDGVQAVLPCKSINEDGKFKILVNKDHYHDTRAYLMEKLKNWINDQVAPDAKLTLTKYPCAPEVAPINSDGFSRGEHSYMNISVNTAFSIGSKLSDSSPPTYVFQDTRTLSDDSSLGRSRTTSLGHTRTWADTVAGRRTLPKESSHVNSAGIDQSTTISDLESSRAEVETLKSKVAQLEAEKIEQQNALADTVQKQVSKAVQDQMALFTAQMTQMFANLVTTLHQAPGATIPKRSAQDMEADDDTDQSVGEYNSSISKRRDNKKSPIKQSQQRHGNIDHPEWQAPVSRKHQESQPQRDQYSPQEATRSSTLFLEKSVEINMSQSDDEDINTQDSGNESTFKPLTTDMEDEAPTRQ